jgi:hypothetical protein
LFSDDGSRFGLGGNAGRSLLVTRVNDGMVSGDVEGDGDVAGDACVVATGEPRMG